MTRLSQTNKLCLVVDANVIGYTSHGPLDPMTFQASMILCRILYICHKIVLDIKKPNEIGILDEYQKQAKTELARWWVIAMQAVGDKIVYRYRAAVHFSILSDPTDEKYLQVAVNSPNRIIISEDSDLSSIANHVEVTSKGIEIWGFELALSRL